MMWGSDYPHSASTVPQSRKIRAEMLARVPDDEQAKIAGGRRPVHRGERHVEIRPSTLGVGTCCRRWRSWSGWTPRRCHVALLLVAATLVTTMFLKVAEPTGGLVELLFPRV